MKLSIQNGIFDPLIFKRVFVIFVYLYIHVTNLSGYNASDSDSEESMDDQ